MCMTPSGHPGAAQSSGRAVAPLRAVTEQHQVVLQLREPQPLFGMANKAIVPHREPHQRRAVAHAMGGTSIPGAWMGVGNFSQRFVCFAGFLFKSKAIPSLGFLQCLPQEPVTAVPEYK